MDMDLSLILGPIVLAVVFNVFTLPLPRIFFPLVYALSSGCRVRNVYHSVVQLLHLRVQGPMVYPVCALPLYPVEQTLKFLQAARRMGLFLGHLPYVCRNIHVMGIRGTELRQTRDLCSSPLVSLFDTHRVRSLM